VRVPRIPTRLSPYLLISFSGLNPNLSFTPDTLSRVSVICRQVQGLPLAIELAVGWADTLTLRRLPRRLLAVLISRNPKADYPTATAIAARAGFVPRDTL